MMWLGMKKSDTMSTINKSERIYRNTVGSKWGYLKKDWCIEIKLISTCQQK